MAQKEAGLTVEEKPFRLSIKVVIFDDAGRCLLLKRSRCSKGNPGKWDLPGGKVNSGEDFDRALIREVIEETGLRISLTRVIGGTQRELDERAIAYLIMEARLVSGSPRLSGEHEDFTWIEPAELHQIDLVEQFKDFIPEPTSG